MTWTSIKRIADEAAPKRLAPQTAHQPEPWADFLSEAANFNSVFRKLEVDKISTWPADKLKAFARATEKIAELHRKAVELLA